MGWLHYSPRLTTRGRLFVALAVCCFIGLALRIHTGRLHNIVSPDEIFQSEEPAHHIAYGYGVVTWEWREGVRSWVFPAFLALLMRCTDWMGSGSAGYQSGIVIGLSGFSLIVVWFGFSWAYRASGKEAAIIAAVACALWYELVNFGSKALTEVVATDVLLPGLYLGVYGKCWQEKNRVFMAALLCGLAAALRLQLAPTVLFAVVSFCAGNFRRRLPAAFVGLTLPLVAFGFVDAITWSYPFQSFYRYFWANVVEGRSAVYGREAWYWYLGALLAGTGPVVLVALIGLRRGCFLGWISLIVLVSHSIFSHKEMRFIYPLLPIVITLAAIGIVEIFGRVEPLHRAGTWLPMIRVAVGVIFFSVISLVLSSRFPYWDKGSGAMIFADRLSMDSSVCGVGIYEVYGFRAGGYAHLHRRVPMILVPNLGVLEKEGKSFNFLITEETLTDRAGSFNLQGCERAVCLYRRKGGCTSSGNNEINTALALSGN